MANIVYGNPFGSALEGKRAALQDVLHTGEAARQMRDTDLNYDFMKWYQPLREAQSQAGVGGDILKRLNEVMHYTGDPTAVNTALLHYFGVPPEALPQSYNSKHVTPDQQKAADLGFGGLPIPLSYPGVIAAGGAYQALPGNTNAGTGDPELDALYRQVRMKGLKDYLGGGSTPGEVPHLNPLGQQTAQPLSTRASNTISGGNTQVLDGDINQPPARNPASDYGVPLPPRQPPASIFEGEYQPPGGQ